MEQEDAQHTIAVYAPELERLALGHMYQPQYEGEEQQQHACRADESLLLAYSAEDEVCILLRDILQLRLCAVEESLALQSSRAYGYLALMDIVACSGEIFLQAEEDIDALALVALEDIVEDIARRIEECDGAKGEEECKVIIRQTLTQASVEKNPYDIGREG